jgi:hypothetical protein
VVTALAFETLHVAREEQRRKDQEARLAAADCLHPPHFPR